MMSPPPQAVMSPHDLTWISLELEGAGAQIYIPQSYLEVYEPYSTAMFLCSLFLLRFFGVLKSQRPSRTQVLITTFPRCLTCRKVSAMLRGYRCASIFCHVGFTLSSACVWSDWASFLIFFNFEQTSSLFFVQTVDLILTSSNELLPPSHQVKMDSFSWRTSRLTDRVPFLRPSYYLPLRFGKKKIDSETPTFRSSTLILIAALVRHTPAL